MSERTRQSFFGHHRPMTQFTCGYDGGDDDAATCGERATWHGWPGDWSTGARSEDATVYCCDDHFPVLDGRLWDYHQTGGACGIPGSIWVNGVTQGVGLCRSETGEAITLAVEEAFNAAQEVTP